MTEAFAISQETNEQPPASPGIEAVSPQAVRTQLERILESKAFARSPRISRFLAFVVDQTIEGQESKLKEYLLGVEVFGRLDSFDPRIDSIVRVEARRLRFKLDKYYDTEGQIDPIRIHFRKGCYVPSFAEKRPDEEFTNGELADVPYVTAIENPHAFALYARGRYCLDRWTPDGIAEAVSCFTQVLDEDTDCASAHAGLATSWMFASLLGLMPARDVVPKAQQSAMHALAISPDCSEARSILGIASALYDWEWSDAEPKLRKAVLSNPCDTGARLWYGLYLVLAGRPEDAVREARKAQQAAPTSLTAHLAVGFACHSGRAYDEALMQYRLAQDLDPKFYGSYLATALLFTDQQMFEQAQQMLNRAAQLSPNNPAVLGIGAYAHAAAARKDQAAQSLNELSEMGSRQYVSPVIRAMAFAANGYLDAAYRQLEDAIEERSSWLPLIRISPAFEAVRQDPRYDGLLARMNLA